MVEKFLAPGTLPVTGDAIVSIDLDSLAWNKERKALDFLLSNTEQLLWSEHQMKCL